MSILNPVSANFTIALNTPQEIYACPAGKSHAIVDISFLKPSFTDTAIIAIALTKESNPANLTSIDYFVDDIQLTDSANFGELNKIVVGSSERLIVTVVSGVDINLRLTGVEESNPRVVAAGKLVATAVAGTAQTQIYANQLPSVAYIAGSLTMYNPSASNNAVVEVWVGTGSAPTASELAIMTKLTPQDTTIVENILLLPSQKLFVRSDQVNCEYYLSGMVVSSV